MKIDSNLHSHDQMNYEFCKKILGNRVKKYCKEDFKQKYVDLCLMLNYRLAYYVTLLA